MAFPVSLVPSIYSADGRQQSSPQGFAAYLTADSSFLPRHGPSELDQPSEPLPSSGLRFR
jgi:hypothetical protein